MPCLVVVVGAGCPARIVPEGSHARRPGARSAFRGNSAEPARADATPTGRQAVGSSLPGSPPRPVARSPARRRGRRSLEDILQRIEEGELPVSRALALIGDVEFGAAAPRPGEPDPRRVAAILQELDALIGLQTVKRLVREIHAFIEIQRRRRREGLATEPMVLHMIFRGNPGTGKTTVGRIFGTIFAEMGVLQKGHLVEVERADLVGEFIGHTAQRTRDAIRRALGGILFIDEAYALARGGEKDFGKEAIDTLVKHLEDQKDNLVVILAGYQREMQRFLESNPGLQSRFPIHIDFPDYTLEELLAIADAMLERRQYRLTREAREELARILAADRTGSDENSGNARLVRNLIERAMRRQATRLVQQDAVTREDLMLITREDLRAPEG